MGGFVDSERCYVMDSRSNPIDEARKTILSLWEWPCSVFGGKILIGEG